MTVVKVCLLWVVWPPQRILVSLGGVAVGCPNVHPLRCATCLLYYESDCQRLWRAQQPLGVHGASM